jgi:hypothetical protein
VCEIGDAVPKVADRESRGFLRRVADRVRVREEGMTMYGMARSWTGCRMCGVNREEGFEAPLERSCLAVDPGLLEYQLLWLQPPRMTCGSTLSSLMGEVAVCVGRAPVFSSRDMELPGFGSGSLTC